jgi:hypothetical protein
MVVVMFHNFNLSVFTKAAELEAKFRSNGQRGNRIALFSLINRQPQNWMLGPLDETFTLDQDSQQRIMSAMALPDMPERDCLAGSGIADSPGDR